VYHEYNWFLFLEDMTGFSFNKLIRTFFINPMEYIDVSIMSDDFMHFRLESIFVAQLSEIFE
jgi:hypothetical protein